VAHGLTVLLGSRDLGRGEAAAREIAPEVVAIQLDVTDQASIAAAAARIRGDFGRLDLLVNNAFAREQCVARGGPSGLGDQRVRRPRVYQAMLPLLRNSSDARIVNLSSGVGSLTTNSDPAFLYRAFYSPVYPASKAALNAITLAMMIELESTGIKVNLVSPGFTKTHLNGYEGTESIECGSREVVRVALLGPEGPSGAFTRWENAPIPW
jgi:NAD(P)-dependent dehydrogenase (short-subunit alcohol dehydrogenase family)